MHQENIKMLRRLAGSLDGGLVETTVPTIVKLSALKNIFSSQVMMKDIM
jgi:hypothetical protein